jgi:hypothetical protein
MLISLPPDWSPGMLEGDATIWGFYLERNGVLTEPESVPDPIPGTYPGLPGESFNFPSVTYPAGTRYDLFILSFDPVGVESSPLVDGTITFDGRLLFVSDDEEEVPVYGGIEGGDWVTISPDLRTLELHFAAGPHVDQLFLAVEVPEPASTYTLAPIAVALLVFGRRLRRMG